MASAVSKRQQARSERQLQELIQSVPGNDRCADCAARNPGWTSWSLGIFLCVRCASLHRKLGTHVSKVKSLSMDSWSAEQVDNMRKIGNVKSNAIYNPRNVKPDIPIDADEVDSAMERFLRQKYESRTLSTNNPAPATRRNTGSTDTGSWNEETAPLPPKPKRFGFNLRSSSSTFSRPKQDRFTPPLSPAYSGSDRSAAEASPYKSKPSQVFGMKITTVGNNFDAKLASLRDMGFSDNRRNSEILKSSNGSMDKAVETLVRLGEGSKPASRDSTSPGPRALTPVSMGSAGGNGITIEKTRQPEKQQTSNPWEIKAETSRAATQPLPLRSQSADPSANSWNPFLAQPPSMQPYQSLESSFQNLQVSHTGPGPQQPPVLQPPQMHNLPYQAQQVPANPWQMQPQMPQQANPVNPMFFQQQPAAASQVDQFSNPYLQTSRSETSTPSNPWTSLGAQVNQSPAAYAPQPNPWASQSDYAAPVAQQSGPWTSQLQSQAPTPLQSSNPFGTPSTAAWPPQQQNIPQQPAMAQPQLTQTFTGSQNPWQQQQQQQSMPPQQTGIPQQQQYQQHPQFGQAPPPMQHSRYDKSSILALYNMPQQAPRQPLQTLPEHPYAPPSSQQPHPMSAQRSVTMPVGQSINPFMSTMSAASPQMQMTQGIRHVSHESVGFVGMPAGGRHSPDAFGGLSAQYR